MALQKKSLFILDGACGTSIQNRNVTPMMWSSFEGCNEYLNLSAPQMITEMHLEFLEAGADIIETNTFGASSIVLREYGLEDQVEVINQEAVKAAKRAVKEHGSGYIAGSLGPGTKLPTLGHIGVDELAAAYKEQIEALVKEGVDLLILETAQDLLQIKTALITLFETLKELDREDIPVMVSITIETTGTMLAGTSIEAAAAVMEPFPIFSFGLNCATGPEDMESTMRWLHHNWDGKISCLPNQGLPEIIDGKTTYPMSPVAYSQEMKKFVTDYGVTLVGGCCGTTPAHIKALKKILKGDQ